MSMNPLLTLFLRTDTDFLTVRDLYQLRSCSKLTYQALEFVEYDRCRDGNDYLVPFPGYPGILLTKLDVNAGCGLFAHQLASLKAMHRAENSNTNFGTLRGGVLGDAPGLGKTITMLAMIASTSGLRPVEPKEFYDDESIDEHWKLMRTNPVFREEILRALKPLRDCAVYHPLAQYTSPPYKDGRFLTLKSFERYVNHETRGVQQSRRDIFRRNVISFKAGLDKRNRRFFANDRGKRMLFERNLVPCCTTLIIVPDALLEHWVEQIRGHLNLESFVDHKCNKDKSHGVVYIDGVGDLSTARFPLNYRSMSLPSSYALADYLIVVVPFLRIKQEYASEVSRKREREYGRKDDASAISTSSSPLLLLRWFRIVVDEGHELGQTPAGNDVTKLVNRMGAERRWVMSGTPTTGNSDSHDFTSKGLDQLQRLLLFLRHERYGTLPGSIDLNYGNIDDNRGNGHKQQAKSDREKCVKNPFLKKQDDGRKELYGVLDEIMVMHKKEDLSLPKPIFRQSQVDVLLPTEIQFAIIKSVESTDANEIESALKIIGIQNRMSGSFRHALKSGGAVLFDALASEYMNSDNFQSLVDEAQAKFIIDSLKRERLELKMRGGAILDRITAPITSADTSKFSENRIDRRPVKAVIYSKSHNNLLSVAEYLYDSFDDQNVAELTEGKIEHMSYDLGRFRLNFKQGKYCPICGGWNDYIGRSLRSCRHQLLEVFDGVHTFLIEPERIKRAVGNVEFNSIADANIRQLGKPVEMTRLQGASLKKYGISNKIWKINDLTCVDARDPHCLMKSRWEEDKWAEYGSARCIKLRVNEDGEGRNNYLGPLPNDDSGFRGEVIVRLLKWQACGVFHSRPRWDARRKREDGWYNGPTLENVDMLKLKEDTFILLLDASLSHGLDLSFVTHIYLLEPIDDAALLEQVTSRAHRLGCTAPVTIDTINVWQKLDTATRAVAKRLRSDGRPNVHDDEITRNSTAAVCEYCYRSFESLTIAEIHESTCDRNPDSTAIADPYHLSSVYRDIRPPAPMIIGN